jgi:hypothetical protein
MDRELSQLAASLSRISEDQLKYDQKVKEILGDRQILAIILSETVEECKGYTPDEIMGFIEGEITINKSQIEPDFAEMITGLSQEVNEPEAGYVTFDIRTYIRIPDEKELAGVKILIDVEAQKDDSPGYDIPLRVLFYCARALSREQNREFTTRTDDPQKYGNIKKVYSICICMEAAKKRANTIVRYKIDQTMLYGKQIDMGRYDIMEAIIVNIGKTCDTDGVESKLLCVLSDIFNENMALNEKFRRLEEQGVTITRGLKEEINNMTVFSANLLEKGLERGIEQGKTQAIINMLERGKTPEQIADFCGYPLEQVKKVEAEMLSLL